MVDSLTLYTWRGDDEQKRLYPYVQPASDIATFNR